MKKILFLTLATSLVTAPAFAEKLSSEVKEPVHAQVVVDAPEANKDATGATDVKTSLVKNIISSFKAEAVKKFVAEHKVALAVGTVVGGVVYAAVRKCKGLRKFLHLEPKEEVRTADLYL